MFVGISDIFKLGIGPSSSHTMGPMTAGYRFLENLSVISKQNDQKIAHIQSSIHGSLAFTGKGHASDRAIFLGLMGFQPATLDPAKVDAYEAALRQKKNFIIQKWVKSVLILKQT